MKALVRLTDDSAEDRDFALGCAAALRRNQELVPSGVSELVRLQSEGYHYVEVP